MAHTCATCRFADWSTRTTAFPYGRCTAPIPKCFSVNQRAMWSHDRDIADDNQECPVWTAPDAAKGTEDASS